MTEQERRKAWAKLPEQEKKRLEEKRLEIVKRSVDTETRIIKELKAAGKWEYGVLDRGYPELKAANEVYRAEFRALLEERDALLASYVDET